MVLATILMMVLSFIVFASLIIDDDEDNEAKAIIGCLSFGLLLASTIALPIEMHFIESKSIRQVSPPTRTDYYSQPHPAAPVVNEEAASEESYNAEDDGSESEDSKNADTGGSESEESENAENGESESDESENAEAGGSGSENSENVEAGESGSEESENADAGGSGSENSENADTGGSESEESENAENGESESEESENADVGGSESENLENAKKEAVDVGNTTSPAKKAKFSYKNPTAEAAMLAFSILMFASPFFIMVGAVTFILVDLLLCAAKKSKYKNWLIALAISCGIGSAAVTATQMVFPKGFLWFGIPIIAVSLLLIVRTNSDGPFLESLCALFAYGLFCTLAQLIPSAFGYIGITGALATASGCLFLVLNWRSWPIVAVGAVMLITAFII